MSHDSILVFDRRAVRRQRERAAANFAAHDFLAREVAGRLAERLDAVRRPFPRVLDLGGGTGAMARAISGRPGTDHVVTTDSSLSMAREAGRAGHTAAVADEELLPFAPASFDLVASNLALHWVNDLPGTLAQIRRVLRPDGLFLGALFGAGTLAELRQALLQAESELKGGARPRVAPFPDLRDGAALLQRAGFADPVADGEAITVTYEDALRLMHDLRGMAEGNAVAARWRGFTGRGVFLRAGEIYRQRFAQADGRAPATFQVMVLTGWSPTA
jgi:NADH dehydrogenase [ubiquinone] 1 alpha subcomplex assembly factor 5